MIFVRPAQRLTITSTKRSCSTERPSITPPFGCMVWAAVMVYHTHLADLRRKKGPLRSRPESQVSGKNSSEGKTPEAKRYVCRLWHRRNRSRFGATLRLIGAYVAQQTFRCAVDHVMRRRRLKVLQCENARTTRLPIGDSRWNASGENSKTFIRQANGCRSIYANLPRDWNARLQRRVGGAQTKEIGFEFRIALSRCD
jgi:hypothetical protein